MRGLHKRWFSDQMREPAEGIRRRRSAGLLLAALRLPELARWPEGISLLTFPVFRSREQAHTHHLYGDLSPLCI